MRFCNEHWTQLREKVIEQGMFHLVAKSGEELANRMKKEAPVPDPLMEAHNLMLQRSIDLMGIAVMGDCCPLCEANKNLPRHHETNEICADAWINSVVPYLKSEYIKEGWIKEN